MIKKNGQKNENCNTPCYWDQFWRFSLAEPVGVLIPKERCCLEGLHILETLLTRDLWIAARVVENHLVGIRGEEAERAIRVADFSKQTNALKVLFRVCVNRPDSNGNTLLHKAVMLNSADCVKMVLEVKRYQMAKCNDLGMTPLHLAANEGLTECVEMLLQPGKKQVDNDLFFLPNPWDVENDFVMAFLGLSMPRRDYLSQEDYGGPDVQDNLGRTPLYLAALCGSEECVRLLLAAGADVNARKPFPASTRTCFVDFYSLVSSCGLDWGRTQLHIAANSGHASVAQRLISAGANVGAVDELGRTPLHLAASGAHTEVVKILLAAGADAKAKDRKGKTPHDCARTREIVNMLPALKKRFPWCCKSYT